jgi:CheY-like chemotaxis protein
LKILAVDDEAGTRMALDVVLKLAGHEMVTANGGEDALKLFEDRSFAPDIVITNHNMPGLNGLAFVRRLKERRFPGIIIVLTAYAGSQEVREYRRLGAAGMMEKPFNVAALRDWMDCVQACKAGLPPGEHPPCPPGAEEFCWWKPG